MYKLDLKLPRNWNYIIPPEEIKSRFQKIYSFLKDYEIFILISHQPSQGHESLYLPFRQNSDFFYFTGLMITPAILFISKQETILFYDNPKPEEEIWTGIKPNYEEIKNYLDFINDIKPFEEYKNYIPQSLEKKEKIYYPFGTDSQLDYFILSNLELKLRRGRGFSFYPSTIQHSYTLSFEIRMKKSPYEIQLMKEILQITEEAHKIAWKFTNPGIKEYEIHSEILKVFRKYNALEAYPSIVASGENACILHYIENTREIKENELILIDAGAQKNYIHTDITRTYPSNGKFNPIQKMIYEVVLEAQNQAIQKTKIGYCMEDAHYAALFVIIDFLRQEKLLKESTDEIIEKELYKTFYMHRTGHYLGYDVHDFGFYSGYPNQSDKICTNDFHKNFKKDNQNHLYRKFEPNMVCTVEPGLYFSKGLDFLPEEFKGIGIRIEDDVLVTEEEPVVLSSGIPKNINDIEMIMQQKSK